MGLFPFTYAHSARAQNNLLLTTVTCEFSSIIPNRLRLPKNAPSVIYFEFLPSPRGAMPGEEMRSPGNGCLRVMIKKLIWGTCHFIVSVRHLPNYPLRLAPSSPPSAEPWFAANIHNLTRLKYFAANHYEIQKLWVKPSLSCSL